jgi:hypothetical protein
MNTISFVTSIAVILILIHGAWVLAYAFSLRRVLQERLQVYAA